MARGDAEDQRAGDVPGSDLSSRSRVGCGPQKGTSGGGWATSTRRRFVVGGGRILLGATALFGGLVGLEPTPFAWAVSCLPGTRESINNLECQVSCVGICNPYVSGCEYNIVTGATFECFCPGSCEPPDVRAVVNCGISGSYGCCVAC
jgi:hypothetical protein